MNAENAIKTIEQKKIRIGRIAELNDPFELIPGLSNSEQNHTFDQIEKAQKFLLNKYNEKYGIVSFSSSLKDPVLWSHYADEHRGIALSFDFERIKTLKIIYKPKRIIIPPSRFDDSMQSLDEEVVFSLLSRKAPSWKYEKEFRFVVDLDRCDIQQGNYFLGVAPTIFKEVILGARCSYPVEYLKRVFQHENKVEVKKAKLSLNKFEIEFESSSQGY